MAIGSSIFSARRCLGPAAVGLSAALAFSLPAPAQDQEPPADREQSRYLEYTIGVGDVIVSSVWKNPELKATAPVRPDGRVGFPLIGEVEVASLTPNELQEALTARYERFINAPAVSVVISDIESRKVFVLGEVNDPGVHDILRPTRLLQALAMAGGLTEYAKEEVVVLRDTGNGLQRLALNLKAITSGRRLEDNVWLFPGDTIVVP